MKTVTVACLLGLFAAMSANAAAPPGVPVDREINALAKTLQARLPALAVDGMCEAKRQSDGWDFTFRVKADQASSAEVQVIVRQTTPQQSELRIIGVHVQEILIGSKRSADPDLSKEWSERILKLIEEKAG